MEASEIRLTLQQNAVWVVFLNVFLQQIGLPVPAVPTLLLAGRLAVTPGPLGKLLAAAIVASVVADWAWYLLGRAFGYRVLAGLCRLSINPGSCVSQTEARFVRWGVGSLVVAKFIPGFSTVAPPIAGSMRMPLFSFLLAAGVGAGLWAGLALGAGWLFQAQVLVLMGTVLARAESAILLILGMLAIWLGWKLWQKFRFRRFCAVPHITPAELLGMMESGQPVRFLDLRGASMIAETGLLPGATVAEHDFLSDAVADWPVDQPIVTLCACPEDAGAVQAAKTLLEQGYLSVRPLLGGYDAWIEAGGVGGRESTVP